jgi:hypothetical protein
MSDESQEETGRLDESLEHQAELFQQLCDGVLEPRTLAEMILIIHRRLGRLEALLQREIKAREALDYIDDHGRALEAMEIMKAQQAEIKRLRGEPV